jgi:putative protease
MSLKDLCTIDMIPELVEAGIDSFKIEGRMKQPDYVYTVAQMYRKYTDIYLQKGKKGFHVTKEDKEKLENCYRRRGYCDGYYRKQNGKEMLSLKRPGKETEPKKEKMDYILQEKIDGALNLAEGTVSELTIWLHDRPEMTVTVTGDMVQTAKNQPLAAERIEKQIRKTGNTPFVFEEVYIDVSGNLFLPMQSLNELRRAALSNLEVQITEEYRRHMIWSEIQAEDMSDNKFDNSRRNYEFQISVETVEQLKLALAKEYVDRIFISDAIAFDETVIDMLEEYRLNMRDKKHESKICLAMPYIFRERAMNIYKVYFEKISQYYEGVLVRNWEALEWMKSKGYKGEILSDYNLYGWNNRAIKELSELGIDQYTSSVELNFRELSELSTGGNLIVYGYQPVMITANCIRRTTEDCLGKDSMLYITDRLGNKFPVKNYCKYCYNIIYNSAPIVLLDQKNEIRSLEPSGIRLNFTLEKEREMEQILESYKNVFLEDKEIPMPDISFTRGHFKRGVK